MARFCSNCFWCFNEMDELYLEGYEEDDPKKPVAGDCCLGVSFEEMYPNKYVCKKHRYLDGIEFIYTLYDDKYLGPGYFIIYEVEGEIEKFAKIYLSNNLDFPYYNIRAYQKGATDHDNQIFRDIVISFEKGEKLYDAVKNLAIALNTKSISSIDPIEQGRNNMSATFKSNLANLIFSKDIYGVKHATDFIDINVGDYLSGKEFNALNDFYQMLKIVTNKKANEEDILRLTMASNRKEYL